MCNSEKKTPNRYQGDKRGRGGGRMSRLDANVHRRPLQANDCDGKIDGNTLEKERK